MNVTKEQLSVNELMVLSSAMRDAEKSLALGYLMLIGGHLGIHRFYLKRNGTAALQLVLFLVATLSYILMAIFNVTEFTPVAIGFLVLLVLTGGTLFIWIIVDLFLLPRMIKEWNTRVEQEIIQQIIQYRL